MKYFTRFLNLCLFIFVLTSLAACKTMRTSEKAVSESEICTAHSIHSPDSSICLQTASS